MVVHATLIHTHHSFMCLVHEPDISDIQSRAVSDMQLPSRLCIPDDGMFIRGWR
jgi:hypothetical protein